MRWPYVRGHCPVAGPVLLLVAYVTISAPASAVEQMAELTVRVTDVLAGPDGSRLPGHIRLEVAEIAEDGQAIGRRLEVGDFYVILVLELTHHVLFADMAAPELAALGLTARFTDVTIRSGAFGGGERDVIVGVGRIYPAHPRSAVGHDYRALNPGCPEPDFHRRYIRVPVAYDRPEWGEFDLYYELCSDFDESRPTIIVPTDGQRMLSQVGWADRYKEIFATSLNVVTYEYRGMPCSPIAGLEPGTTDWWRAAVALHSDQVVEDIERIRQDLLGDRNVNILGGSGTAMIGLKYLSRYGRHVDRALLMSLFKDARGSSEAGNRFLADFLRDHDLTRVFARLVADSPVAVDQLLFLMQRLLYADQQRVVRLIEQLDAGERTLFDELTAELGTVANFVESAQRYRPWTVVFMHETNLPSAADGEPDINAPFYLIGEPLARLVERRQLPPLFFDVTGLEHIDTEVLLIGGTLDPVAPIDETMRIHHRLPNSSFAIFAAQHCLDGPPVRTASTFSPASALTGRQAPCV
jgi:pimeloyl-ACP methyl ester carboxylesterase